MSRSRVLLLLIVVLLLALWYAWKETPRQQRAGDKRISVPGASASPAAMTASTDDAFLDFSGGEQLTYKKPKRDLFRPLYREPATVKRVVPARQKPPEPPELPTRPPPIFTPLEMSAPVGPKPIPPLEVLGFLRKGQKITAFLASRQGDLYLVHKGDRFADGLIVRELDGKKIVIDRGEIGSGITIALKEQKTQRVQFPDVSSGRPSVPIFSVPEPETSKPVNTVGEGQSEK